jgi:hypothetical protein
MDTHRIAQMLGRLGGKARAKKLSASERSRIASLGGLSRSISRNIERRIVTNLSYSETVTALRRAGSRINAN